MEVDATHTGIIQDDSCVDLEDIQSNESSGESSSLSGNTVC